MKQDSDCPSFSMFIYVECKWKLALLGQVSSTFLLHIVLRSGNPTDIEYKENGDIKNKMYMDHQKFHLPFEVRQLF